MSEKHENLAAALAAFQGELTKVSKSNRANVPTKSGGSYSYTYADLADVAETVYPLLSKHGLAFVCQPHMPAPGVWVLRANLLHESGDRVKGSLPIHGNTPQEFGSALTYMRRYLLGCLTGVVTDDDDDGATASRAMRGQRDPREAQRNARKEGRPSDQEASDAQRRGMFAAFEESGIFGGDPHSEAGRGIRLQYMSRVLGRELTSTKGMGVEEVAKIIDAVRADMKELAGGDPK